MGRLLNDIHSNVANGSNKAFAGLEDSNPQALSGVLGHIILPVRSENLRSTTRNYGSDGLEEN